MLDFVMSFKKVSVKEAGQWLIDVLERSADQEEPPVSSAGEEPKVTMQAMCRVLGRYLSTAFPMLGEADRIAEELGELFAQELEILSISGE